jgi:hypothetical protein
MVRKLRILFAMMARKTWARVSEKLCMAFRHRERVLVSDTQRAGLQFPKKMREAGTKRRPLA